MEAEVYPVERAIAAAREKHLAGKADDAKWTCKDLVLMRAYRDHLSAKIDAQQPANA
jgi:hypothetical protein